MHKRCLLKDSAKRASTVEILCLLKNKKVSPLLQDIFGLSQLSNLTLLVQWHLAVYNCLALVHQKKNFHL